VTAPVLGVHGSAFGIWRFSGTHDNTEPAFVPAKVAPAADIAGADHRINAKLLMTTRHPPRFDLDHTFFPSRAGQHSFRINDQYRVCFVWRDGNAFDVEIMDYH